MSEHRSKGLDRRERAAQGGCPASSRRRALSLPTSGSPALQDVAFLRSEVAHGVLKSVRKPDRCGGAYFHERRSRLGEDPRSRPRARRFRIEPLSGAGPGKSALRRPGDCRLHRADPRAGRRPVRTRRGRDRAASGRHRLSRRDAGRQRPLFDHWADNAFIRAAWSKAIPRRWRSAPIRLRRQFRMNRQATVSLECRGVLAYWDHRLDELVVYLSTPGRRMSCGSAWRRRSACRSTRSASSRPTSAAASAARTG